MPRGLSVEVNRKKSWGVYILTLLGTAYPTYWPGIRTRFREARIALCTPETWLRGLKDNRQGARMQGACGGGGGGGCVVRLHKVF